MEAESKMKKKKKKQFVVLVLGFYALRLCPWNQTQQLITENID